MLTVSVKIDRSVDQVWGYFVTPSNWIKWYGGVKEVVPGWKTGAKIIWASGSGSPLTKVIPGKEICMSGGWMDVTYKFNAEGNAATIVELVESDPKGGASFTDGGAANEARWERQLQKLKECIEDEIEPEATHLANDEKATQISGKNNVSSPNEWEKFFGDKFRKALAVAFLITATGTLPLVIVGGYILTDDLKAEPNAVIPLGAVLLIAGLLFALAFPILGYLLAFKLRRFDFKPANLYINYMSFALAGALVTVGLFYIADEFVQFIALLTVVVLLITASVNGYKLAVKSLTANRSKPLSAATSTTVPQANVQSQADGMFDENKRSPEIELELKADFGITITKDGFNLDSDRLDTGASQLTTADECLGVLQNLQKRSPFTLVCVCITSSSKIYFVCNTKPKHIAVLSGLNGGGDIALFDIALGGKRVVIYRGLYLLKMP